MSEYSRTTYNFNDRIVLNDTTTDPDQFILVKSTSFLDTIAENTEGGRITDAGIIDYGTKFGKGIVKVPIALYASSFGKMNDLIQDLKEAFNPDLLEADSTYGLDAGGGGYHPLKWTETVGETSRSFMVYLKSMETPRVALDQLAGLVRGSDLTLKAQDPRKYLQAASSLSGAGTATNAGTYPTPVTITITATGTTSTSLQITNSTRSESVYVTTALSGGQALTIDTRKHSCLLGSTERRDYLGNNTKWMQLDPGANTIAVTNGTNATISTSWYSAWPL
jgi:hypothetical protein